MKGVNEEKFLIPLREKINSIDISIVGLLDERAKIVKEIGEYKKRNNIPIYQPEREKEVKELIISKSKKEFPLEALLQIFTEIVSAARALEKPLVVAFLGPEGSFTEQAVRKHFGSSVIMKPIASVPDIFREVENGKMDYGVVAIENSLDGSVKETLDEFIDSPLKVLGEEYLNIHQNLMANVSSLSEIKRIYTHPQSFGQCRTWLETNLPSVERIEVSSNSKAASMVPWEKFSAAIGPSIAAEKYSLNILAENIEDNPENYTRFWIIGSGRHDFVNTEKTSILVSIKDSQGALLKLLTPFKEYNINLSKIESRPSKRKPWDYLFFIDLDKGIEDNGVQKALEQVRDQSVFLKVLGSYKKGTYL
jgi:chorismate mutase/prephenate dehydratase